MIIIHDTFVCKPGNASKLAKMIKESMGHQPEMLHVMTDMTGQWHRVIMVSQHENLAAYEENVAKSMEDTPENQEMAKKFANMNDMYVSGSREIYKAW
jgi:hypothetical protein